MIKALSWTLSHSKDRDKLTHASFIEARVPGAVQLDIAAAEGYPDFMVGDRWKLFRWMEEEYFLYRAVFPRPDIADGQELYLVSKGIDYSYHIYLNGKEIHSHEGMFAPVELRIDSLILDGENILDIVLDKVPKSHPFPEDQTQANACAKPAVSYGWDWHPRLIPLGIWDETGLELRPSRRIDAFATGYTLNEDCSSAQISISSSCRHADGLSLEWTLLAPDGKEVAGQEAPAGSIITATLDHPELWWTHDHGEQALYTSILRLKDRDGNILDSKRRALGFRRVRLVMNEDAWEDPSVFPKTRGDAPIQMELNGRRIFCKGSNWVSMDIFPGLWDRRRYEELLALARDSHLNILRVWGGSAANKDAFYELCDRLGILIWQEFPLACNSYPDDPHYLSVLEAEARALIERLKPHPCHAIWCGGNELFNSWSGMDDQSLALRLLGSLCFTLDPHTPFLPTSPLKGMGHGHYAFRWQGEDVFSWMRRSRFCAYTEFGMPGISPREVLEHIIPPGELFPPKPGTAWQDHHAFRAWGDNPESWLDLSTIGHYFGEAADLDELIEWSGILQCAGYKCIFEEARRQKPHCSMALNWCFNEPWPSAANNSLVVYPCTPKPALQAVADSCRPVLASAAFDRFQWSPGEELECGLWLLNDTPCPLESLSVTAWLCGAEGQVIKMMEWETGPSEASANLRGPVAKARIPQSRRKTFTVRVCVKNHPEMDSSYTLALKL